MLTAGFVDMRSGCRATTADRLHSQRWPQSLPEPDQPTELSRCAGDPVRWEAAFAAGRLMSLYMRVRALCVHDACMHYEWDSIVLSLAQEFGEGSL